jgi:DNA-directed RNA polymerase subunit K/omega
MSDEESDQESISSVDSFIDDSGDSDTDPYDFYFHNDEDEIKVPKNFRTVHVIPPEKRRTSNVMTEFEMTRAIAIRAKRINDTGNAYVVPKFDDAIAIAKQEFLERKNPLILIRQISLGNTSDVWIEKWKVREMVYPEMVNNPLKDM